MKKTREKIGGILSRIFGIGILIALSVGGLSFVGYMVALIVGGDTAQQICTVIYKRIYPVLFAFSSIVVLLGLVTMYIKGEKSMAPTKVKKQAQTQVPETATKDETKDEAKDEAN